jgi:hypothetical protein
LTRPFVTYHPIDLDLIFKVTVAISSFKRSTLDTATKLPCKTDGSIYTLFIMYYPGSSRRHDWNITVTFNKVILTLNISHWTCIGFHTMHIVLLMYKCVRVPSWFVGNSVTIPCCWFMA